MKKMPIIFDMTFDSEGEREVLHTIREEIHNLVNTTLVEGKRIVPTFKRDGTAPSSPTSAPSTSRVSCSGSLTLMAALSSRVSRYAARTSFLRWTLALSRLGTASIVAVVSAADA